MKHTNCIVTIVKRELPENTTQVRVFNDERVTIKTFFCNSSGVDSFLKAYSLQYNWIIQTK